MTFWEYCRASPVLSLLEPWANKVWDRAKENNSPYNNKVALQNFVNNTTRNGKYTVKDILNVISAFKLVKNQYPALSENTKDFTTKMLELSKDISKIDRLDVAAIRMLVVLSIYPSDGALYKWLHGSDSDGIISKLHSYFENISYSTQKTSEIVSDKVVTVAEGVNTDLQKYFKYGAIIFASYVILQGIGLAKSFRKSP